MSTRNVLIANHGVIQRVANFLEDVARDETLAESVRETIKGEIDRLRSQARRNRRVLMPKTSSIAAGSKHNGSFPLPDLGRATGPDRVLLWPVSDLGFYLGEAKNILTGVEALSFGWPIPLILSLISWVVHGW